MAIGPTRFITLEGGEGVGKSTQVALLAQRLRAIGLAVTTTREPGGSPGAEALRTLLLSGRIRSFGPTSEAYLFAAARIDHIAHTIRPALEAGHWIICDRFADSTRIYQGGEGGLPDELLDALENFVTDDFAPDLTLILDAPIDLALERRRRRGGPPDRFEADAAKVHERRRAAFLALAEHHPQRCAIIDASETADSVGAAIWAVVTARFSLPAGDR